MRKDLILLLAVSFIILSICFNFFFQFGHFSNSNDYLFHFHRAKGECFLPEHYGFSCNTYPILFNLIASNFALNEIKFFLFAFALIFVLTPFLLWLNARNQWVIPFYLAISTPFNFLYAGVFPQALILVFLLGYLYLRQFNAPFLGFLLVLASFFTHQYGFLFMALIFVLDHLFKANPGFPALVLVSVKFTDRLIDSALKFPLVFGLIGLKQLIKDQNWFLFMAVILTFFGAFMDLRVLLFTQSILIIPASVFMANSKPLFKKLMLGYLFIYLALNLYFWVYLSQLNLFLYI